MGSRTLPRVRQARGAIIGFGCNQAFLFAMLYFGSYNEGAEHGFLIDRADLLCLLVVAAGTFALMMRPGPRAWPSGSWRPSRCPCPSCSGGSRRCRP